MRNGGMGRKRMSEEIFKEIANEIKRLNHEAVMQIGQGNLENAEILCKRALEITESLLYYDGMAIALYNLANLEAVRGDLPGAISYAGLCRMMHEKAGSDPAQCDEVLAKLAKAAMRKGMEFEKNGEWRQALDHYQAAAPFSEEKYRQAMLKEIEIIRKVSSNE